jgi:hypothetical protein
VFPSHPFWPQRKAPQIDQLEQNLVNARDRLGNSRRKLELAASRDNLMRV